MASDSKLFDNFEIGIGFSLNNSQYNSVLQKINKLTDLSEKLKYVATANSNFKINTSSAITNLSRVKNELVKINNNISRISSKTINIKTKMDKINPNEQNPQSGIGNELSGVAQQTFSLYGALQSINIYKQYEDSIISIGRIANLTDSDIVKLKKSLNELSVPEKTNQSILDLLKGFESLVAYGMEFETALSILEQTGKVATATGSDLKDINLTAFQMINAFKINPKDIKDAFDGVAQASKLGNFELKDMARYLPGVAASAESIGLTGKEGILSMASALQITRRAATDVDQASNNLFNLLQKLTFKDAVKNFKDFGVDIEKVLKNAKLKGLNPFDEALKEIIKITGGDKFKLAKLFGDMQVTNALMPLMTDFEDYIKIKNSSMKASALIDQDYDRTLKAFSETSKSFFNMLMKRMLGFLEDFLPIIQAIMQAFIKLGPQISMLNKVLLGHLDTLALIAVAYKLNFLPSLTAMGALFRSNIFLIGLFAGGFLLLYDDIRTFKEGGDSLINWGNAWVKASAIIVGSFVLISGAISFAKNALIIYNSIVSITRTLQIGVLLTNPFFLMAVGITVVVASLGGLAFALYKYRDALVDVFKGIYNASKNIGILIKDAFLSKLIMIKQWFVDFFQYLRNAFPSLASYFPKDKIEMQYSGSSISPISGEYKSSVLNSSNVFAPNTTINVSGAESPQKTADLVGSTVFGLNQSIYSLGAVR